MKTDELIKVARRCVDDECTDCHGCLYEGDPCCMDWLITDLADRLEEFTDGGDNRE